MNDKVIKLVLEAENTRKEMLDIYNSWLVESSSMYNKIALKRSKTLAREFTEQSKKLSKLITLLKDVPSKDLFDIRNSIEQQKTTFLG